MRKAWWVWTCCTGGGWEVSNLQILSIYDSLQVPPLSCLRSWQEGRPVLRSQHWSGGCVVGSFGGNSPLLIPQLHWGQPWSYQEMPLPPQATADWIKNHPDPDWANQIASLGVWIGAKRQQGERESDSWFLGVCVCWDLHI